MDAKLAGALNEDDLSYKDLANSLDTLDHRIDQGGGFVSSRIAQLSKFLLSLHVMAKRLEGHYILMGVFPP